MYDAIVPIALTRRRKWPKGGGNKEAENDNTEEGQETKQT
jgi:hypothetical protein